VDLVGLEELPGRPLRGEGLRVEEEVVDAVDLAGPHRPRGAGDDVVVVGSWSRAFNASMIVSFPTPLGPR
jgi:hypothetical protein